MHSAKRYLAIALTFALALTVMAAFAPRIAHAVTATMVQVVNTGNNPVPTQAMGNTPVSSATHVGQPSANLVTLAISQQQGSLTQFVFRILPDGSVDAGWTVPNGQTFVITDWSWFEFGLPPSMNCFVSLAAGGGSSVDVAYTVTDANGQSIGRVTQVTAAIGPGATVQVNACNVGQVGFSVHVHGYLTSQ